MSQRVKFLFIDHGLPAVEVKKLVGHGDGKYPCVVVQTAAKTFHVYIQPSSRQLMNAFHRNNLVFSQDEGKEGECGYSLAVFGATSSGAYDTKLIVSRIFEQGKVEFVDNSVK